MDICCGDGAIPVRTMSGDADLGGHEPEHGQGPRRAAHDNPVGPFGPPRVDRLSHLCPNAFKALYLLPLSLYSPPPPPLSVPRYLRILNASRCRTCRISAIMRVPDGEERGGGG